MLAIMMAEPGEVEASARPASGFVAPAGDFGARVQQLAHVTAELAAAETIDAVIEVAVTGVAVAVRAAIASLMVMVEDRLSLVGAHGLRAALAGEWASFGVAAATPASEAARTGAAVIVADVEEFDSRYPDLRGQLPSGRSVVCLPLNAGQVCVGVIGLGFDDSWVPGPRELDFLSTFADAGAQAIRRINATEAADERATQLAFLAEASDELASSLDYRATLRRVARLAVRSLSDWCAVAILADGELDTLAVEHADPAKVAWAWELQKRYPSDKDAPTGAPNVVRTGVSELFAEITDEMLVAGARDEEHLRLARELKLRSALIVPLTARGRTLGVITLIRAETGQRYSWADLAVAEDLGRRAGVAIDNALLYSQTRDVALQLQRAVLPDRLDDIAGWQIATYYRPGGHADVGGDFYDAIPIEDGKLAVIIGDVMGHGIAAAAAMAHIRAAVRAYLCIDSDPSAVVGKLDHMFARLGITQLVSLVYAVIDPVAGMLSLVNAGHHPPLLIGADGSTRFAQSAPRRILGVKPDDRAATHWQLTEGSTLLLYTDGLVERRDEDLDFGVSRMVARAPALAGPSLAGALRELVLTVSDEDGTDDVTALAVRPLAPASGRRT
jgi:GAF domain-containing protein